MSRTIGELNLWVSQEERDRHIALLREHGRFENSEVTFRRKTGEIGIGALSAELIELAGEPCSLAIVRDVTEQKRVENGLRSAETLFRNLVEHSLVGIYIIQEGKYAYANSKLAEIFGYTEQEVLALDSWLELSAEVNFNRRMSVCWRRITPDTSFAA